MWISTRFSKRKRAFCQHFTPCGFRDSLRQPLTAYRLYHFFARRTSLFETLTAYPLRKPHRTFLEKKHQPYVLYNTRLMCFFEKSQKGFRPKQAVRLSDPEKAASWRHYS
jgi:hypothetical protein